MVRLITNYEYLFLYLTLIIREALADERLQLIQATWTCKWAELEVKINSTLLDNYVEIVSIKNRFLLIYG